MKIKQSFSLRYHILWQAAFETGENSNKYLFYRSLTALICSAFYRLFQIFRDRDV